MASIRTQRIKTENFDLECDVEKSDFYKKELTPLRFNSSSFLSLQSEHYGYRPFPMKGASAVEAPMLSQPGTC
jgi:hypothetical protein